MQAKDFRDQWSLHLTILRHLSPPNFRGVVYEEDLNAIFSASGPPTEVEVEGETQDGYDVDDLEYLF